MKSIMHEASSLAKAIEQGWEKAGKPTDFSIKILEKPQKNFFGLTTHPAKIALYFDERSIGGHPQRSDAHRQPKPRDLREVPPRSPEREQRPQQQRHTESRRPEVRTIEQRPLDRERSPERARPEQRTEPDFAKATTERHPRTESRVESDFTQDEMSRQPQQHAGARQEAQWNEAMTDYAREWLDVVLPESVGKRVGFTIEPNNLYLRITFESPVLENQEKEKRLYASLSLLILEALKRRFKVGLRKHKIILTNG